MSPVNTCGVNGCPAVLPLEARFCTSCGSAVNTGASAPPPAGAPPAGAPGVVYPPQQQAPPGQPGPGQAPPGQPGQPGQQGGPGYAQPYPSAPPQQGGQQGYAQPPPQQYAQPPPQQQQQQRAPPPQQKKSGGGFGGFFRGMAQGLTDLGNETSRFLNGGHGTAVPIRAYPPTMGPVIPQPTFDALIHAIKQGAFMADRQKIVENASRQYHFTCSQVAVILQVSPQDHERQTAINHLAPRIVDRENHIHVSQGPWGYPIQNYINQCLAQYPVPPPVGGGTGPMQQYGRPPQPGMTPDQIAAGGVYPNMQGGQPGQQPPPPQQQQGVPPTGALPANPPPYQQQPQPGYPGGPPPAVVPVPVPVPVAVPVGGHPGDNCDGGSPRKGPCPKCGGKGGIGAFGPTHKGDIHYKGPCPNCKGDCKTKRQIPCPSCQGKGGWGAFGPCEVTDVHFKRDCAACKGKGFVKKVLKQCEPCQGHGAFGAFGPCAPDDVHFRNKCEHCKGKGWLKQKKKDKKKC